MKIKTTELTGAALDWAYTQVPESITLVLDALYIYTAMDEDAKRGIVAAELGPEVEIPEELV